MLHNRHLEAPARQSKCAKAEWHGHVIVPVRGLDVEADVVSRERSHKHMVKHPRKQRTIDAEIGERVEEAPHNLLWLNHRGT